ncbi:magnesium-translocating P-type ATPase [Dyadobacter sp. 3J3]|uniref:magnesium-translocating P-type ATPase n=1 Tax=Dyadobacter sp. 3J3 TaxID=2606600 RepID=UPI00135C7E21|nr:magnesium-translocating P-type ATPase [Dyadobacter sp. 3J3]
MKGKIIENKDVGFWSINLEQALKQVNSRVTGLAEKDIDQLRKQFGANSIASVDSQTNVLLFINQFKSPITIILLLACALSYSLNDHTNAVIIFVIVLISSGLGFWQERAAGNAVAQLLAMVRITTAVVRDQTEKEIPVEEIVPGDVVVLDAGDVVPADCLIIESNELFVDEAAFTGETFPVDKMPGVLPADTVLAKRSNAVFMGSHVVSGSARVLVMLTGASTGFGHISQSLKNKVPLTEFEIGIKKFGYLLMQITMFLVIVIFGINVFLHKPILDSFLFTLAIAVGLTPQLLPAIITINLSQGAREMAKKNVIVKRLSSIENFGSMDVLCSDKTGTLTEGKVKVYQGTDCFGIQSQKVITLAKVNASLQQGFKNPIDEAISGFDVPAFKQAQRLDEIPYDFNRKRLTLLVKMEGSFTMVTKGAVNQVLAVCSEAEDEKGKRVPLASLLEKINKNYQTSSASGYRTLGVAYRDWENNGPIHKEDENNMVFAGFVTLFDPPKTGINETITNLSNLGVNLKVITGDNLLVAKSMSEKIGIKGAVFLSGENLRQMSDEALRHQVLKTDVFAEVEPNQKERIIIALKKAGKVVGYMGDGINDASALHAADVGISVNTAVDVAKEAADIVLLDQDLNVLIEGIKEGRRTFANTQKYIFMATSANFGNMFSMAGASLFLCFLPLLPKQILLTNLLTDFPGMTIASDTVDEEWIKKPRKWDIAFIKRFMIVFGLLSSVFDYLTFGVLLYYFKAAQTEFQTGWFIESVVSATLIVLVVRTRKPFFKSQTGKYLMGTTILVALIALSIPWLPFTAKLGFAPLPFRFYMVLLGIVTMYLFSAEILKHWFYKRLGEGKVNGK